MKPINLNSSTCSPISSNCVIWQGPDIQCINLCSGDTISDVTEKLAIELCNILNILNVENYDLSCFNINSCGPTDFKELIQFLIARICELEGVTPTSGTSGLDCPVNCIVTVASCLVENGQVTMNLVDYVNLIANRICTIISEISIINSTLDNHETRITALESAPAPSFTMPTVTLPCDIDTSTGILPSGVNTVVASVEALAQANCDLISATGTYTDILNVIVPGCALTDIALEPGWVPVPSTLAESINNVWISICYLYSNLSAPVTVTMTDSSTVNFTTVTAGPNYEFTADVIPYDGMLAQDTPVSLTFTAPGIGTSRLCDGAIQLMNEVYDDANAYDPLTGIWTCPATGRYNLSLFAHFTNAGDWYDALNPGGMFGAGIMSAAGCNFYAGQWITLMRTQKHIDITAQAVGMQITAGTQLCLKVMNLTGINYISQAGDVVRFSVQRIR